MPDAATAGGSSPRLCVWVDAAVLLVAIVLENALRVWSVYRHVACAIGGATRDACLE